MNIRLKRGALLVGFWISLASKLIYAQAPASLLDGLHPVSPTTWQFSKYTDLPVSEYTGIPNISIPLYKIETDGVKVPIDLTYHASGIKVNEEASWVGLGWDLQIGSIVQTINGKDDFSTDCCGPYIKWLADWQGSPVPSELPRRYNYPFSTDGTGWFTPYPGTVPNAPQPYDSYKIGTDYYFPVGTNFNIRNTDIFTTNAYDSEPDVFKANFLGYSINFVLDWNTNQLVILNKKGYKVTRNSDDTWAIVVPGGEEFDFTQKSFIYSNSTDQTFNATTGSSNTLSSKVWMLTKIITKNKKQIIFNYSATPSSYNSFPSCTQKIFNSVDGGGQIFGPGEGERLAYGSSASLPSGSGNWICTSTASTLESYMYLSSITFPNGSINFNVSSRQDMNGAMKLDSLSVSTAQIIKSFKFNYGYFNGGTGGNGYTVDPAIYSSSVIGNRLQLQSLTDNSGAIYNFTYNSTPLPLKNSYATDYWGYYNGQTSNTSMVPNASQFSSINNGYYSTIFGNNGNNHSANSSYAQAGILQQIKYPTGGTVNFNYELNEFNNYWVPDFSTGTNVSSHGNGLRIQSITYNQADGTQSKKDVYTYSVGKSILPINIFRSFTMNTYVVSAGSSVTVHPLSMTELNMNGAFSPSMFGSIMGVGYDTVSRQQLDLSNHPNGKTVSIYYNNADIVTNCTGGSSQLSATLPALKQYNVPDNGSQKSEYIYDQQNNLIKKNANTYSTAMSSIYYGARLFGYTNLITFNIDGTLFTYDQHMVGFYPLYDLETLLTGTTETNYFGTDSVSVVTTNSYDQYNQLATVAKTNSTYNETTSLTYPYNSGSSSVLTAMVAQNRLSDVVYMAKNTGSASYTFNRTFNQSGNLFVPVSDNINNHATQGIGVPTVITYDQVDPNNGNILQYTKNGLSTSFIYDYNKEYVIAEIKNAPFSSVAYTSFEADGTGGWTFTGEELPDNTALTGKKDYSLTTGNVSMSGLNTSLTYIVSYWSNSGPQSVNGNTTPTQGYTYNGWTYYEHQIASPSGGTVTVSGSGTIDELRLYPNNAQMTSYTYEPLVGITSMSDAGAKISYYEYDNAKRLLDIRDQNKNIIKAYCYNYAGQAYGCNIDVTSAPTAPFVQMTVASTGNTTDPNGNVQSNNVYTFKTFSDAAGTIPYTLPTAITVNYQINTVTTYDASGEVIPTSTLMTITVPAGSNQANTGSIMVNGCTGTSSKGNCSTSTVVLLSGTNYLLKVNSND